MKIHGQCALVNVAWLYWERESWQFFTNRAHQDIQSIRSSVIRPKGALCCIPVKRISDGVTALQEFD